MDGGRATNIASALAVLGLVSWLTYDQTKFPPSPARRAADEADAGALADTSPVPPSGSSGAPRAAEDGGEPGTATAEGDAAASVAALSLDLGDSGALPASAPRMLKIGIVLVAWHGAEGATTSARSKADALGRATELAALAKTEFRRAVTQGDPGSSEDIGRIPRGTLDARTEMALFSLSTGDVSDPIETPRGYWIVKRLE